MKPQIIPHWRLILKQWSFRLSVIGTIITSVLLALPDLALQVWVMMPADLKAVLPERYMPFIGVAVFVLGVVAKFIRQIKLEAERENTR